MPTNLTPEQRAQIARENGAKSRGPITEEGKVGIPVQAERDSGVKPNGIPG